MESVYTRREAILGLGSAALAAGQTAATPPAVDTGAVQRTDAAVERFLATQITDSASPYRGSAPDDYLLHHPGSASGPIETMAAAIVCPQSRFHSSNEVMARIRLAAGFLERSQSPEGFIDLLATNFNSPPDTGFVVHNVGTAASIAKKYGNAEIVNVLRPFLVKAGNGMAIGGIHTPNHRWVVSSALAQINEVYPNPDYLKRINQWLAETIDIDTDDQYTERSTVTYNTIVDRALVVMAAKLNRPELLAPVRRNLTAMLYLIHPDGEVVTEVSHRQDQFTVGTMSGYWFPASYLAAHDGSGMFAALVKSMPPETARLSALLEYPELAKALPGAGALPVDYERTFPLLDLVRVRRGKRDATLVTAGSSRFFSARNAGAVVNAVRFATSFFGKGQFIADSFAKEGGVWVMRQSLEAPYYQPLEPAQSVTPKTWSELRGKRRQTQICKLDQVATITERDYGFDVRIQSRGTNGVPLAVEISLRDGGTIEGSGLRAAPNAPDCRVLASGNATYRLNGAAIEIGPGVAPHLQTQLRGAEPKLAGQSLYVTGLTPFDHTLQFRMT